MAARKGRSGSTARKKSGAKSSAKGSARRNTGRRAQTEPDLRPEILLFALLLVLLVILLCTIGVVGGAVGGWIRTLMLGLFGTAAYLMPLLAIAWILFSGRLALQTRQSVSILLLLVVFGILAAYISGTDMELLAQTEEGRAASLYEQGSGGGVFFGLQALWLYELLGGKAVPILLLVLIGIFCILTILGRSFFATVQEVSARLSETAGEMRSVPRRYADPDRPRKHPRRENEAPVQEELDEERLSAEARRAEYRAREEARREEHRLREEERRREAAQQRVRKEEEARRAQEEKQQRREEEKLRRKEAEERAEEARILNASRPASRTAPKQSSGLVLPPEEVSAGSPDEMHEITIGRRRTRSTTENITEALLAEANRLAAEESEAAGIAEADADIPAYDANAAERGSVLGAEPAVEIGAAEAHGAAAQNAAATPEARIPEAGESGVPEEVPAVDEEIAAGAQETTEAAPATGRRQEAAALAGMPAPVTERTHEQRREQETAAVKETKETPAEEKKASGTKPKRTRAYHKPPIELLKKNEKKKSGDSDLHLQETATHLRQTLQSFGVSAEVIGISQGPSVTRFELQPAEGTKVNKIVGLADDLKLSLAAPDIRIEAPIPGKAAVGIEVPNKETSPVYIRELIESKEYASASSKIAYAVGKDISGGTIISDIAKMPHLLVAGATGSGKSVFINTLIMSILYEATPEEVKLIMIDPKFVELSVYNGIPHLLLPVVTDPRQANAALAWAVAEMTRRYRLFETNKVRGLPAYNELVDAGKAQEEGQEARRLPQIVVIVDELADLMMVASKEVEESICRLAQLARAAGIHLVIATQRPSVNVITGLIKANMPSRIAFKVSSGVDSRTILDMIGAERLLGNGDMLFSPQSFTKPLRVQGAFVSDSEVTAVVDFLKANAGDEVYDEAIVSSITSLAQGEERDGRESAEPQQRGTGLDSMFDEVARYVVEKEKASSTMLQRIFKISYNRAVRIIDQLEENGVIGPEAGTKPRHVLMDAEQLERFLRNRKEEGTE